MHIVGELKMDYRGYRRLVLPAMPKVTRLIPLLFAPFMLLLVAAIVVAGGGWSGSTVALLLGGIFCAGAIEFGVLVGWLRMARTADRPWRYVVTDSTVELHMPFTDSTIRWDGVRRVRTLRDVWVLRLANSAQLPIPRAAFTVDDAARIDAFVAGVGAESR